MNAHAPIILGNRQEQFCQQILASKSAAEAYRIAYNAPQLQSESNGPRLMRNDRVIARIAQLRAHDAAARRVTIPFLTRELLDTAREARAANNQGAANSCYQTVAKMHGLLTDKIALDIAVRKPSADPDSPDDMSEAQWLESAGLVIEHIANQATENTDQSKDYDDQVTNDARPVDPSTNQVE